MNLSDKIRLVPMLRILIPLAVGILLGGIYHGSTGMLVGCTLTIGTIAWARAGRRWGSLYTFAAILLTGMTGTHLTAPRPTIPREGEVRLVVQIVDPPERHGRWDRCTAYATHYALPGEALWREAGEKIVLRSDSSLHLNACDQLAFTTRLLPVASDDAAGYLRLMQARGYTGAAFVSGHNAPQRLPEGRPTLRTRAALLQRAADARLSRLDLTPDALAVCTAMTVGTRSGLTSDLKADYARVGASHLLAVSGLHVGIIFVLVNLLLWPLPLLRYGHRIKPLLAITAVWAYACMSGLSPSVIRSAFMFTGVQLALAGSWNRNAVNTLSATAVVMLCLWPGYLRDISFQLSTLAVAALLVGVGPLYRRVRTRYAALNFCWSAFIVGAVASLGTLPLIALSFDHIPLAGILLDPLLLVTAHLIVLGSLLGIVLPFDPLREPLSRLLETAAGLQNRLVEYCAAHPWAGIPVHITPTVAWIGYVLLIVLAVWMATRPERHTEPVRNL